jgi:DNA-binding response OmpR family regulator
MTTILHVEDDPSLSDAVKDAFEAFGFRGTFLNAASVYEATRIVADLTRHARLDLVISDMNLPDGSGLDVIRAVRANPARDHVPVIILSGEIGSDSVNRAYMTGANSFVSKGVRGRSVSQTMRALYEHWLRDVQLPVSTATSRTQQFLAKAVNVRTRKASMYMRVAEALGPVDGALWMDLALRDGNLANLFNFLLAQLDHRALSPQVLDEAEVIQAREIAALDDLEHRPVKTREDALRYLRVLVSNFNADVIARMIGQLFPIVPVAMATLRGIAASILLEVASWIETHATDRQLRDRVDALRSDAARIRVSGG